MIERLGYDSGMWDTFIRTDSNIIAMAPKKTDGRRRRAAAEPRATSTRSSSWATARCRSTTRRRRSCCSFVSDEGKGFVAAHVGLTALESWPEFGEMLGAPLRQHPIYGPGVVDQRRARISRRRSIFRATFPFRDEFYQPKNTRATRSTCYFASICRTCRPIPTASAERRLPDGVGEDVRQGPRVVSDRSRIRAETWDIRDVQLMYLEAMRWSLGMSDADLKPHPMVTNPGAAR